MQLPLDDENMLESKPVKERKQMQMKLKKKKKGREAKKNGIRKKKEKVKNKSAFLSGIGVPGSLLGKLKKV